MFDDSLVLEYLETFYGYGNLDGKYWFIGMEDGSDGTDAEIVHRLNHWKEPCTGQVRVFRRTFGEAAPNDGFGVWWFCPLNPALTGNACHWVTHQAPIQHEPTGSFTRRQLFQIRFPVRLPHIRRWVFRIYFSTFAAQFKIRYFGNDLK